MKFTNGGAYNMMLSLNNMIQKFGNKDVSSVLLFGIMRNIRILSTELKEFEEIRQKLMEKYKIDEEHKNDEDLNDRIQKCESELSPITEEEIKVDLHHISYDFDRVQDILEKVDVPINIQDVISLQLICKQPEPSPTN